MRNGCFQTINKIVEYSRRIFQNRAIIFPVPFPDEVFSHGNPDELPGITREKTTIAQLPAEWVKAGNVPAKSEKVILYFHALSSNNAYDAIRHPAPRLSMASGVQVLLVESLLDSPKKRRITQEDCLAVYRWLIDNGFSAKNIIIGGDSSIGCLAVYTLINELAVPPPAAAFLLSPPFEMVNSYFQRTESHYRVFVQIDDYETISDELYHSYKSIKTSALFDATKDWTGYRLIKMFLSEKGQAMSNIGKFVNINLS